MTSEDTGPNGLPRKFLKAELAAICRRRGAVGLCRAGHLVGLALSGGGIRSATFALGVLQRLARSDLLKHFDYLSTVSGGGYIGGALTWLLNHSNSGAIGPTAFPYGTEKRRLGRNEPKLLKYLRLHGNYLTPGRGITALSLVAVLLRGIVLNLLVWLPLAVLFFWVLQIVEACIIAWTSTYGYKDALAEIHSAERTGGYGYPEALALAGMGFLLVSVFYSLVTRCPPRRAYWWRRLFECGSPWLLGLVLVLAVLCSLPIVVGWARQAGAAAVLAGLAGGLVSFAGSGAAGRGRISVGVLAPVASVLLLYGLALVSYDLADQYRRTVWPWADWLFGGTLALSVLTGWCVNLNYVSLHRYYRDRLMEAFMRSPETNVKTVKTGAAWQANRAKLQDMCVKHAPYHLVNTNVVLVDSDDPRYRKRGGDAFLLSPLCCGGTATGWISTNAYMRRDPLTLPTAIAISGAAANPNTGAGGVGPTRHPLTSLLMGLLNIRLGYWVPSPRAKTKRQPVASHFRAARYELHRRGYAEHQNLLQLSDGGHFENLGVYELVRRQVKVIVCCDAAADPGFDFKDLQVLEHRIRTDFGARIEFDDKNRIELLIPREPDPQKVQARDSQTDAYPVGARFAERGYIRGAIVYPNQSQSTFILLKTTMIRRLGLLLKGYKGANRAFPDQTTADQFFDEEQFEAYRELGYALADTLLKDSDIDLEGLLRQSTEPAAVQWRRSGTQTRS